MALRDVLVKFGVEVDQTGLVKAQENVRKLTGQFQQLNQQINNTLNQTFNTQIFNINNNLRQTGQAAREAAGGLNLYALALRAALAGVATKAVTGIIEGVDGYIELENRLKAATKSTEDFVAAQKEVFSISRATATPVKDVAEQFQRYNQATEALGVSQAEVLDFTKRVNQATKLGGATAQETRGALIQLAQGLGTDFKAAGQEIRSIQKSAPLLAAIIAKSVGGTAGELTTLAKNGKLSSKIVFDAVREAGDLIDKEFAQRKLRFEDISSLFGTEWLALIKQLEPAFSKLVLLLVDVVKWTREWVEDGSAYNAFIAGATTGIIALTYAMGGLLASALALAAPFLALFLILDDLVTFMNGGDSLIGDALGEENTEKVRAKLRGIVDAAQGFIKALVGDNDTAAIAFGQLFADRFKSAMKAAIDSVLEYALEKLRNITGIHPAGPQDQRDPNAIQDPLKSPGLIQKAVDWYAESSGFREEMARKRVEQGGWTPEQAGIATVPEMAPAPWNPVPTVRGGQYGPPVAPPVINNTITVEGNADAQTARDIATQTGQATSDAIGRGRDAIGAGLGMFP